MTRFNSKIGAAITVALGAIYLVAAMATGHSATSQFPTDLSATGAGLDVWRSVALMARAPQQTLVADVRPAKRFRLFHLPKAVSLPGADASKLLRQLTGKQQLLLVAGKDGQAAQLAGQLKKAAPKLKVHFLQGGAQAWYVALQLPVELFRDKPAPFGYRQALKQVRDWLRAPTAGAAQLEQALGRLSSLAVEPTLLQGKKKPKSSGKKKKIAGGCG